MVFLLEPRLSKVGVQVDEAGGDDLPGGVDYL